jgi:hypothetical protein
MLKSLAQRVAQLATRDRVATYFVTTSTLGVVGGAAVGLEFSRPSVEDGYIKTDSKIDTVANIVRGALFGGATGFISVPLGAVAAVAYQIHQRRIQKLEAVILSASRRPLEGEMYSKCMKKCVCKCPADDNKCVKSCEDECDDAWPIGDLRR